MDAVQAALLRVKLRYLAGWTSARQANAARYTALFRELGIASCAGPASCSPTCPALSSRPGAKILVPAACQQSHIYNQYVIHVLGGHRDTLRTFLRERGVATEVYYPIPMHLQACFSSLGHRKGDFPVAELCADEALALPIFPE